MKEKILVALGAIFVILVFSGFIYIKSEIVESGKTGVPEKIVSVDRNLILNKISVKTDSGKIVDIRKSKLNKGLFISEGDNIWLNSNNVIIRNESYRYYSSLF